MKSTELRIGNYLQGSKVVQVKTILGEDIVGLGGGDPYYVNVEEPYQPCLTPIPITEEWLIKFGFEKTSPILTYYSMYIGELYAKGSMIISINLDAKSIQISVCKGGDSSNYIQLEMPEYVHQLQNLYYALTNIELTIK